ncbi:MFS transporter [Streptomyces sp. NBC_00209]|uniref:MFS transporter n=1 Tax=Streptomyces sp. NBC_00209 TaxID=2975682 RepID=UPI003244ADE5
MSTFGDVARRPLRRNRPFLILTSGQAVSSIGDQIQGFALLLVVTALAGPSGQAGLVLGVNTAAYLLFGLVSGALADRWDRRRTMLWCEVGRGVAAGAVALAMALERLTLPMLYGFALVTGILSTLFQAANTAALPSIVGSVLLPRALAVGQGLSSTVRVTGASLGALAWGVGRAVPFAVDAVSFLLSAVSLGLIKGPLRGQDPRQVPAQSSRRLSAEIREGLGRLWNDPVLRRLTLAQAGDSLRYGAGYLVIVALAQAVGASATQTAYVFTGAAVGALVGAAAADRLAARYRLGRIAVVMLMVEAAVFPLYAVAPSWMVLAAVAAAESVVVPVYSVAVNAYRMRVTPDAARGRVAAAAQTLVTGALSLGTMLGGVLIAAYGARTATFTLGCWLAVVAVLTASSRQVRQAG